VIDAIDVHTHIFAPGWPDFAARFGGDRWPRLEGDPSAGCKLYLGATFNRNLTPHAFDPARRIEDMDRTEVATQLLSPAPPTFCYWAPLEAAAEWHRMQNDVIADIVARHPKRFLGAGGLPMQAPNLAVKELERVATTLHFPAVEIAASVDGRDLDDASLDPVWAAAAALGVAVFVHPQAPILGDARFRKNNLTQVAGFPLETALAMTRVIFGGVLQRWPTLRWCFAHGGGAFPYILPPARQGLAGGRRRARGDSGNSELLRPPGVDRLPDPFAPRARLRPRDVRERAHRLGSDYPFKLGWTIRWPSSTGSASMPQPAGGSPPTTRASCSGSQRPGAELEGLDSA
jgi:predicted TIM-barrel fold metal-dependent hydrolase